MIDQLPPPLPALQEVLRTLSYVNDSGALWRAIQRLLKANAPSGGSNLPGAILDEIAMLAHTLGLAERFIQRIGSTGNSGIWLGAEKDTVDVIVVTHMDRPTFKVRSVNGSTGTLYAVCAIRFPDAYQVPVRSLRFGNGHIAVSSRGLLTYEKASDTLCMDVQSGTLSWQDLVVMDVEPALSQPDGVITGTGLDNCLGVATALGAAAALHSIEATLRTQNRRLLFVFTDLEEGIPDAYFGHGAARLAYALRPPTYGCIVADAETAGMEGTPKLGYGAGHGTVSSWSRGSFVPPNYHALAIDLAAAVNEIRPGTVQMNHGYLSRSDDMALGRWTQILGMVGAPMINAHTGEETGRLADVQSAIWWLSFFTAATVGLAPSLVERYALA